MRNLIIIVLIFAFQNSFSQVNDTTQRASINIDISTSTANYLSPSFSYRFSSHEIEAGPLFRNTRYNSPGVFKLSGFDLGYFYYPNHFGKNFDLYFFVDNKFIKCRTKEILDTRWEQDSEFDALIYQYNLGYGFKKVFCKRFFISTDMGIGQQYQKSFTTFVDFTNTKNPIHSQLVVQGRIKLGFYIK
jgi:hypothetical protein